MSGHFNHKQFKLNNIAMQIEHDIRINKYVDETIKYLTRMVAELRELGDLVNEYDYLASQEITEDQFLKMAKEVYGDEVKP